MGKLTELKVRQLLKAGRRGKHGDGNNLWLEVDENGHGWWYHRYAENRQCGLGPHRLLGLAGARKANLEIWRLRHEGVDPREHKRAQKVKRDRNRPFEQVARAYVAAHESGWRGKGSRKQWLGSLEQYVFPSLGRVPVHAIDTQHVLSALQPIWLAKTTTANRLRQRIELILDFAKAQGLREGENPARWRGHLRLLLARPGKVARAKPHAAMPYEQVPAFVAELRDHKSIAARMLEMSILTASRAGEIIGARRCEFDLENAVWQIPGERMKSGKPHRVPLSPRCIEILKNLPRMDDGAHVFAGRKSGGRPGKNVMLRVMRDLGRHETVHGFRAAFRSWAAERTSFSREVCETALAHSIGDETERAYARTDLLQKRRRLMQQWSDYCSRPAVKAGVVVPLHGGASG